MNEKRHQSVDSLEGNRMKKYIQIDKSAFPTFRALVSWSPPNFHMVMARSWHGQRLLRAGRGCTLRIPWQGTQGLFKEVRAEGKRIAPRGSRRREQIRMQRDEDGGIVKEVEM